MAFHVVLDHCCSGFADRRQSKVSTKLDRSRHPSQQILQPSFDRSNNAMRCHLRLSAKKKDGRSIWQFMNFKNPNQIGFRSGLQISQPLLGRRQRPGWKQRQRPSQLIRWRAVLGNVQRLKLHGCKTISDDFAGRPARKLQAFHLPFPDHVSAEAGHFTDKPNQPQTHQPPPDLASVGRRLPSYIHQTTKPRASTDLASVGA